MARIIPVRPSVPFPTPCVVTGTGAIGSSGYLAEATSILPGGAYYYENALDDDLNYPTEAAAVFAGNISRFYNASDGPTTEHGFFTHPTIGTRNAYRIRMRSPEDGWLGEINIPLCSYLYAQWSEYYHPSFNTAYSGKMDRMGNLPTFEHIVYGGPGVANRQGIMGQGSDPFQNIDAGISPAMPRGQVIQLAHEEYLDRNNGYSRFYYNYGSGWFFNTLRYVKGAEGYSLHDYYQASTTGSTAPVAGRKFANWNFGGWYSGAPTDTVSSTNYRYLFDVRLRWNTVNAPHH